MTERFVVEDRIAEARNLNPGDLRVAAILDAMQSLLDYADGIDDRAYEHARKSEHTDE